MTKRCAHHAFYLEQFLPIGKKDTARKGEKKEWYRLELGTWKPARFSRSKPTPSLSADKWDGLPPYSIIAPHPTHTHWQLSRGNLGGAIKSVSIAIRKDIKAREQYSEAALGTAVNSHETDRRGAAMWVGVCEAPTSAAVGRVPRLCLRCPSEEMVGSDDAEGVIPIRD